MISATCIASVNELSFSMTMRWWWTVALTSLFQFKAENYFGTFRVNFHKGEKNYLLRFQNNLTFRFIVGKKQLSTVKIEETSNEIMFKWIPT